MPNELEIATKAQRGFLNHHITKTNVHLKISTNQSWGTPGNEPHFCSDIWVTVSITSHPWAKVDWCTGKRKWFTSVLQIWTTIRERISLMSFLGSMHRMNVKEKNLFQRSANTTKIMGHCLPKRLLHNVQSYARGTKSNEKTRKNQRSEYFVQGIANGFTSPCFINRSRSVPPHFICLPQWSDLSHLPNKEVIWQFLQENKLIEHKIINSGIPDHLSPSLYLHDLDLVAHYTRADAVKNNVCIF